MIYLIITVAFVLTVLLSLVILPQILLISYKTNLLDYPNGRTVHLLAIPRLGGVSFLPSITVATAFTIAFMHLLGLTVEPEYIDYIIPEFCFLTCGLIILYLVGIRDDLAGLRYRTKFVAQFIVSSLFPLSGLWINNLYGLLGIHELTPWLGIPFTILLVMLIINSINLIDGIDGLASGLCAAVLALFGVLYLRLNLWLYATLAFSTLGTLIPFFYYNVFGKVENQKKIFMGDTGSLTLGYILAFLAIRYASHNPNFAPYSEGAIVVAFSLLLVPLLDVLRVILIRLRNKKSLFVPDRNHIHHKFLEMGYTHRKAMISIIGIAILFGVTNVLLIPHVNSNLLFFGDIVAWIALHIAMNYRLKKLGKPVRYYDSAA